MPDQEAANEEDQVDGKSSVLVRQRCLPKLRSARVQHHGGQCWVTRQFEEGLLDAVADRSAANLRMMQWRKGMVEHPFGTLDRRMDGGRFPLLALQKIKVEMVLAMTVCNLTRDINVLGTSQLC